MRLEEMVGQLGLGPGGPVEPLLGRPLDDQRRISPASWTGIDDARPLAWRGFRPSRPRSR